jgi:hypothetical protein
VEAFLATSPPQPAQMFDYHYASWPVPLARQRIEALGEG